jgi:hypothetical protein
MPCQPGIGFITAGQVKQTVRYYGKKTGREMLLNHFLRAIILPTATLSRVGEQIFTRGQ